MQYTHRWRLLMIACVVLSLVSASAVLADPYTAGVYLTTRLGDVTAANNGGGLSTIDSLQKVQGTGGGIHFDATFRIGNSSGCDAFLGCVENEVVGNNFDRVTIGTVYPPGYLGPSDLSGFMSYGWWIMTDTDLDVRPWVKTTGNFTYWEAGQGTIPVPGDGQKHFVELDFANGVNYAGLEPNPGPIQSLDQVVEVGIQIEGPLSPVEVEPGPPYDPVPDPVVAHIWIIGHVPEPSSMILFGLGAIGCLGLVRRRSS